MPDHTRPGRQEARRAQSEGPLVRDVGRSGPRGGRGRALTKGAAKGARTEGVGAPRAGEHAAVGEDDGCECECEGEGECECEGPALAWEGRDDQPALLAEAEEGEESR